VFCWEYAYEKDMEKNAEQYSIMKCFIISIPKILGCNKNSCSVRQCPPLLDKYEQYTLIRKINVTLANTPSTVQI
jgi:hypothetical protein